MRTVRKMVLRAVITVAAALPPGLVEIRTVTPERKHQPGCPGQGC